MTDLGFAPFELSPEIPMPTPAQLRELEAAVSLGLAKLDDERPWEAVDDVPPDEHRGFRLGD